MYHYDPETALEELNDEAVLPNTVHVRDMILRRSLSPERALELHREFQAYQQEFGAMLAKARAILGELAQAEPKQGQR